MDGRVEHLAEVMAKGLLSQGMVEAVRALTRDRHADRSLEGVEPLQLDDVCELSASSDLPPAGQSSSTPRDEASQVSRPGTQPTLFCRLQCQ